MVANETTNKRDGTWVIVNRGVLQAARRLPVFTAEKMNVKLADGSRFGANIHIEICQRKSWPKRQELRNTEDYDERHHQ